MEQRADTGKVSKRSGSSQSRKFTAKINFDSNDAFRAVFQVFLRSHAGAIGYSGPENVGPLFCRKTAIQASLLVEPKSKEERAHLLLQLVHENVPSDSRLCLQNCRALYA